MDHLACFSMIRLSRSQFDFCREDGGKVEFTDRLEAWQRTFDVVSDSVRWSLSSHGFSPPITLRHQETEILRGFDVIGPRCFSWQSKEQQFRIVGRRPDCVKLTFRAFHLYVAHRRIAYWDQPKRRGDIRGIYNTDYRMIEIASVVFGFLYDWADGGNWLQ